MQHSQLGNSDVLFSFCFVELVDSGSGVLSVVKLGGQVPDIEK